MSDFMDFPEEDEFQEALTASQPADIRVEVAVRPPSTEEIANTMAHMLLRDYTSAGALRRAAEEAVRASVAAVVEARITPILNDLLEKPLQPTDGFGNPIGQPTSLQEIIRSEALQFLTTTVDRDGRAHKGNSYDKNATRLEYTVGQVIRAMFKDGVATEVKSLVEQIKAGTLKAISADVAKAIADRVK